MAIRNPSTGFRRRTIADGTPAKSFCGTGITVFVFLFSAMLGGSFIPFDNLPQAMQTTGQWTMIRLGSSGIESLFESRPLWEAFRPSLILSAMGLFLLGLGIRVIRKRFESGNVT